jgi:hypothetical protein
VIDANVQNMDWLAPRATSHQGVVGALHTVASSLLPLPFATLYHRRDALRETLSARRQELLTLLERVAGADEWTLKVFQERAVLEQHVERLSSTFAQAAEEARTAPPGKAYLLRKQLDTLRRDEAVRMSSVHAHEIEEQMRGIASDVIREPIASATAAGRGAPEGMRAVLKLALLLSRNGRDEHMTRIEEIAERYMPFGYRLEIAGPWPAYSFAAIAEETRDG